MKIILSRFLAGALYGLIFLLVLIGFSQTVSAQEGFTDPRDLRTIIPDPRDNAPKPCEVDPREGCARPVPRPSSTPEQSIIPSAIPSVNPSVVPSLNPSVQPTAEPSASSGTGGPQPSNTTTTTTSTEKIYETIGGMPQVKGLSFTGSYGKEN